MLLLSYHRRKSMISEALELRVEGGLVTVDACVWLVIAMVGWVGAWMEVVNGMHAGQSIKAMSYVGRCRSTSRMQGEDTDDTRSHRRMHLWVGPSWSSWKSLYMGRLGKALVRCPCSQLAARDGTPWTLLSSCE